MNNYKITNLTSSKECFLNQEELTNFFKKNKMKNYDIINLTEQKRIKIVDNVLLICFFSATVLSTMLIIENFY